MKISKNGYKKNSSDNEEDALIIPSNTITMKNVPHLVFGIDDQGNQQMMYPGAEYQFPGSFVTEIPIKKDGGIHIKKSHEGRFTEYKKRTGKTTEQALHSKDPHVRKMAQFAENASHWKKQEGGPSNPQFIKTPNPANTSNKYLEGYNLAFANSLQSKTLPQDLEIINNYAGKRNIYWDNDTMNYYQGQANAIQDLINQKAKVGKQPLQHNQMGGKTTPTSFNPLTDWGAMTPAGVPHHNNTMQKFTAGLNNFSTAEVNYLSNPSSFGNQLNNVSGLANSIDGNFKDKDFNNFLRQNQMADSNIAVQPGGNRGDYSVTGSSYGMFRPDQLGAKSPYGMFSNGNYPKVNRDGGLIKAQSGYISEDSNQVPQFLGNSSTRELGENQPFIPPAPLVGPSSTPINFPTYNPSEKQLSVNNNTKAAYDYYTKEKNLPAHIAAGIVGNLYQESGLKPGAVESGNTQAGRGIAQWGVSDRWQGFLSWAKQQGRDPYELKSQLDYVLVEPGESGKALDRLKNTTTPEQAAVIFGKLYERPNEKYADWAARTSMAGKLASGSYQLGGNTNDDEGNIMSSYQIGGEYEMDEKELKAFMKAGGSVEYI